MDVSGIVHFIISGDNKNDLAVSLLKKAAEKVSIAENMTAKWVEFDDIGNGFGENGVVVCETFKGKIFEKLKKMNCRIYGPMCIIACLESKRQEGLPVYTDPILNIAMVDLVICCTNLPEDERRMIRGYIKRMGGSMDDNFTPSVTHLITNEVGSKKYMAACQLKCKIMKTSWVYDCYKKNKHTFVPATDKSFDNHVCSCFQGLTICVTGMSNQTKSEIERLTIENGGRYDKDLNMKRTTHLLVRSATGDKYQFAIAWKINCVSLDWFYDCLQAGHWLQEDPYFVLKQNEGDKTSFNSSRSVINETEINNSVSLLAPTKAAQVAGRWMQQREDNINQSSNLKRLSNKALAARGQSKTVDEHFEIRCFNTSTINVNSLAFNVSDVFLDGCKIYLTGIPIDLLNCLRKLVNAAGAMRLGQLNDSITHIILGDTVSKSLEDFLSKSIQKPHVVSPTWLIDSCQAENHLDEKAYSLIEEEKNSTYAASVLAQAVQKAADSKASSSKYHLPSFHVDDDDDNAEDEMFCQYLPQAESSRICYNAGKQSSDEGKLSMQIKDFAELQRQKADISSISSHVEENVCTNQPRQQKINSKDLEKPEQTEAVAGLHEQSNQRQLLFGKKFVIKYFDEEQESQIQDLIEEYGGEISKSEATSDHTIVPVKYEKKRRIAKKEVTICWLEQCLESDALLSVESCFLFRPFHLPDHCQPLADCVLTVSQFSGIERQHLCSVAELLGACVQDNLARKSTEDHRANTHLLLMEATGTKYEAAVRWGVKCVSKQWLCACAAKRTMVKPEKYPLRGCGSDIEAEHQVTLGAENDTSLQQKQASCLSNADVTMEEQKKLSDACYNDGNKDARPTSDGAVEFKADNNLTAVEAIENKNADNQLSDDSVFDIQSAVQKTALHTPRYQAKALATPASRPRAIRIRSNFKPSFDLSDVGELLRSPACFNKKSDNAAASGGDDSLVELFNNNLQKALKFVCAETGMTETNGTVGACDNVKESGAAEGNSAVGSSGKAERGCSVGTENAGSSISSNDSRRSEGLLGEQSTQAEQATQPDDHSRGQAAKPLGSVTKDISTLKTDVVCPALRSPVVLSDSSLDARIEFKKQMDEFMEATKGNKEGTKRVRRPLAKRRLRSKQSSQRASNDPSKSSSSDSRPSHEAFHLHGIEPTPGDLITYDDAADSRKERERILAQMRAASPSQDIDQVFEPGKASERTERDLSPKSDHNTTSVLMNAIPGQYKQQQQQLISSPPPPPINLQITHSIQPPEPVNLLGGEEDDMPMKKDYSKTHRFLLSSLTPQEKIRYSAIIEEIGGVIYDDLCFRSDCTHVIAGSANRSEKFMAAVAAGKWVLHKSYLEASREDGVFVDEESHEFGTESEPTKLSSAARKWRLKLANDDKTSPSKGAYTGWNVLLCGGTSAVQKGFKNILEAGGAVVRIMRSPFSGLDGITHAFVDKNGMEKSKISLGDIRVLNSAGILLLKPDYMADYLMYDTPPSMLKYQIPEVLKLAELDGSQLPDVSLVEQKKRKSQNSLSLQNKRLKK